MRIASKRFLAFCGAAREEGGEPAERCIPQQTWEAFVLADYRSTVREMSGMCASCFYHAVERRGAAGTPTRDRRALCRIADAAGG